MVADGPLSTIATKAFEHASAFAPNKWQTSIHFWHFERESCKNIRKNCRTKSWSIKTKSWLLTTKSWLHWIKTWFYKILPQNCNLQWQNENSIKHSGNKQQRFSRENLQTIRTFWPTRKSNSPHVPIYMFHWKVAAHCDKKELMNFEIIHDYS